MSLFDVIRYPISDPPTAEELYNLPEKIFSDWKFRSSWSAWPYGTFENIIIYYKTGNVSGAGRKRYMDDMYLLKKLIKDHGEPV